MFQVNEVLNLQDKLYRILVSIERQVVWISLDDSKALPDFARIEQLNDLLLQEKMTRVDDPYEYVQSLLPEEGAKDAAIRDKNYLVISPLS
ncbi:hypothetical protein C0J08_03280 [Marinomonas sp. CT5]|uniref:hypothetical protein n=1 Tax=Marinomonas sp. CT5 TaxID=2066133 RepID=UPI001BAE5E30|nr:hypothetical protein [Marinomonas sp. CT5]QUX94493.1 hypothetical protein C0J08_03280 [Marinomonas sp. CT5]